MTLTFTRATRYAAKLRLTIVGPSGTGKTFTALAIAQGLVPGGRVAVIDTEHDSAAKYADRWPGFTFDHASLTDHSPASYIKAIKAAEAAGYDCIIIDSLSHAWAGRNGALELVDQAARRSKTGNSFSAWREVTPQQNALVDAIVSCKTHLIATMRSKAEYVQEQDGRGKTVIRKVGLAPVQRDGIEFEFDVLLDMDFDHTGTVTKSRCSDIDGKLYPKPGVELGEQLREWLSGPEAPPKPTPEETKAKAKAVAERVGGTPVEAPNAIVGEINEADSREALGALGERAAVAAAGWTPQEIEYVREAYAARLEVIRDLEQNP